MIYRPLSKFDQILEWPDRRPTVGDLTGSWSVYVSEMASDMRDFTSEVIGDFGYHDYVGALFARIFVEQAVVEVSITPDDVEHHLIRTIDDYFRSLTRDDPGGVAIKSEPDFERHAQDPNTGGFTEFREMAPSVTRFLVLRGLKPTQNFDNSWVVGEESGFVAPPLCMAGPFVERARLKRRYRRPSGCDRMT